MASYSEVVMNNNMQHSSQNGGINTYNGPYYISGSDNPGVAIVSPLFNGDNYLRWSRNMRRALGAKNKLGFITGSLKQPDSMHRDFQAWNRCDYLVASWITHSMTPELAEDFSYIDSA